MSTIAAGTSTGTALVNTGDTTGALQLQVNGTTPSVTLAANGSIGVGSTPGYGTNGQVLTSSGTSSAPAWTTPSAGALTLLSTVTASNSATVDVETTFSSTYDAYMLVISGAKPATDAVNLLARMKIGGSYINSESYISTGGYTNLTGDTQFVLTSSITLVRTWGNTASSSCDVVMYIFNPASTAFKKLLLYQAVSMIIDSGASMVGTRSGVGSNDDTRALTGIRFFASSGNISAGQFRLYGIANS